METRAVSIRAGAAPARQVVAETGSNRPVRRRAPGYLHEVSMLTIPVLVIGGENALGEVLAQQMKLVASDVTVVVLKDTGHWVLEERPKETTDALVKFL